MNCQQNCPDHSNSNFLNEKFLWNHVPPIKCFFSPWFWERPVFACFKWFPAPKNWLKQIQMNWIVSHIHNKLFWGNYKATSKLWVIISIKSGEICTPGRLGKSVERLLRALVDWMKCGFGQPSVLIDFWERTYKIGCCDMWRISGVSQPDKLIT